MAIPQTSNSIYKQAANMRSQVQAELILSAFAFIKGRVKSTVPAFGPLSSRTDYKMSMQAMDKDTAAV
ncbi:hypothetical protein [uncultured Amphritea sp.]|uniref:hypothetical protein n=1 Tax=uncultured Amphritea sp. TaxID=981605 RepID=UPI001D382943|nr:hypothetical protein [uncultured Amphritea sp.]MBR9865690.1 hypothetical protein [Oceanospirillales bacterium]MBR9886285.1 hypothetical protein [Oceanospirillales bacterium]